MNVLLLTRDPVGSSIIDWFMQSFPDDLAAVVTDRENGAWVTARSHNVPTFIFSTESRLVNSLKRQGIQPDLGILFWWTKLLGEELRGFPRQGCINTHPSLLPHTAGAMANVWTLIDDTPYGVTIHQVCAGIDDGPILAQKSIEKTWEDTENTLYHKALLQLQELFFGLYPELRRGTARPTPQDIRLRTIHTFKESAALGKIDLDAPCTARKLLNLLRAHSYDKLPGFWFEENEKKYEVRVSIRELKP
jgi:methionyl-tRNA formyltransferase